MDDIKLYDVDCYDDKSIDAFIKRLYDNWVIQMSLSRSFPTGAPVVCWEDLSEQGRLAFKKTLKEMVVYPHRELIEIFRVKMEYDAGRMLKLDKKF